MSATQENLLEINGVLTGLDCIELEKWKKLKGHRLGLLANQASVNQKLSTAREVISHLFPGQLKALFGAQHGYGAKTRTIWWKPPIYTMRH